MSTEQATTGGRETFGEPKKIAQIGLTNGGETLTARVARMGSTIAEVSGTVGPEQPGYEIDKLDFYFKLLPDPSGEGLEGDPALVPCRCHETAQVVRPMSSECKLLEAPLDPIADFSMGNVLTFEYAELSSSQAGEIVERVPAEWLVPFMHQRYDDLSVLGASR
jgi:acetoacetate decarboxylase